MYVRCVSPSKIIIGVHELASRGQRFVIYEMAEFQNSKVGVPCSEFKLIGLGSNIKI